jgi:carbonic anhydrase
MPPGSKRQQATAQQPPAKKSKRTEQMTQVDLRDFIPADIQEYVRGSKVSPIKHRL